MPLPSFTAYLAEANLPSTLASWATKQARSLTDEEQTVLLDYADEGHFNINLYLRHAGNVATMKKASSSYTAPGLRGSAAKVASHLKQMHSAAHVLDGIFRKFPLPTKVVVYRGTDSRVSLFANPKTLVGKTLTLPGYTSTTTSEKIARDLDFQQGILLVLTVPAGHQAIPMVPALSGESRGEAEVLLPQNTRVRVTQVTLEPGTTYDDIWIVTGTVV
jgi:hypothetical protein